MKWRRWMNYLFPGEERRDPAFRRELDRLAAVGLRVIAAVCIGAPLLMVIFVIGSGEVGKVFSLPVAAAVFIWGSLILALSFWPRLRPQARAIGILTGFVAFSAQVWGFLDLDNALELIPAIFSGIMLVGIASLPVKPIHSLGLGFAMMVTYPVLVLPQGRYLDGAQANMVMMMVLQTTLICTGLTVVVYHQRVSSYRARRQAEESFEELRRAQSRLLISENAASQGRFAAALSHELNSPIGAVSSAVDTLFMTYEKVQCRPQELASLEGVIAGATRSALQSTRRLAEIVGRMKHLTNLDRAEEQMVDLNELWTSTIALLRNELSGRAEVELDLRPLPPSRCRPQQMSAVFSNLLRNSVQSMESRGTIRVRSDRRGSEIILEVKDDGRGIPSDRLARLFDPSFRVEGTRVSTTNWGLFISRSIIVEHGGQIEIDSTEGRGTTAKISLPIRSTAA